MNNTILSVEENIEEFMNYGMSYIVWYKVPNKYTGCHEVVNAFITKNKEEALIKQKELQTKAIYKS